MPVHALTEPTTEAKPLQSCDPLSLKRFAEKDRNCKAVYRAMKMAALEGTGLERLKLSLLLFRRISFERNLLISKC